MAPVPHSEQPVHRGRLAVRRRHLHRLWNALVQHEALPQLDRWVAAQMKAARFGKQDRLWYRERLFGAVRFGYLAAFCDFACEQSGSVLPEQRPDATTLTRQLGGFSNRFGSPSALVAYWRRTAPHKILRWTDCRRGWDSERNGLDSDTHGFLRALEAAVNEPQATDLRLAWHGIPLWLRQDLGSRATRSCWDRGRFDTFVSLQSSRPPVWLRLTDRCDRTALLEQVRAYGETIQSRESAVALDHNVPLQRLSAYTDGSVEVQDLASQQIGESVAAGSGDRVWDCCAGSGGKTVQLALKVGNSGSVVASDIREHKFPELHRRAARARVDNVQTVAWDGRDLPAFSNDARSCGGFDWVLVDAPCSGSGTWRRNPEARFRYDPDGQCELTGLQRMLLRNASGAVRAGGSLVYATCSWLCCENEETVDSFLASHDGFALESARMLGCPDEDADSCFAAVLKRRQT